MIYKHGEPWAIVGDAIVSRDESVIIPIDHPDFLLDMEEAARIVHCVNFCAQFIFDADGKYRGLQERKGK